MRTEARYRERDKIGGRFQVHQALADYAAALRLDPHDADAYAKRGVLYLELGRDDKALADFDAAIRIDPSLTMAYSNRGGTYLALGRHAEALADYDAVVRIDPNHAKAYSNRGATYAALGRYPEALADYAEAIRLDPNDAWAYINKGALHSQRDEWDDALRAFEAAAGIGHLAGAQYAAQVRQDRGIPPEPASADPAQHFFLAFLEADTPDALRRAVERYPILVRPAFLVSVEHTIPEQAPPAEQPALRQRLNWLCQLTAPEANP
jgi:tetratricopeptide (TPR) repeat protein